MIKFSGYRVVRYGKLRLLKPPYKEEDFELDPKNNRVAFLYGGVSKCRLESGEIKLTCGYISKATLLLDDENDHPKVSSPRKQYKCNLWFTSMSDAKRFLEENKDYILDTHNLNVPEIMRVNTKWSYYVLKYD